MRCASMFSGIAGIEVAGAKYGVEPVLFCERDEAAQLVLTTHFPDVERHDDITTLAELPASDIVTAGFPCTDLSPVGRLDGIDGANSSLIRDVFRLIETARRRPDWVLIENVPFMLKLDGGRAMREIVTSLERLGYAWAYRIVDTRAFGFPQRRRRVVLLASRVRDPRPILLLDDEGEREFKFSKRNAHGFYWTEGNKGIGWAVNAIPTLKGGSKVGIPSPPAIWLPDEHRFIVPTISDAERLQGFERGWTEPAETGTKRTARWRLVGNAVSVPVFDWVFASLADTRQYRFRSDPELRRSSPWPNAAWGRNGKRCAVDLSEWPVQKAYQNLRGFLSRTRRPLSTKAARGFLERLERSTLRVVDGFKEDLREHVRVHTN